MIQRFKLIARGGTLFGQALRANLVPAAITIVAIAAVTAAGLAIELRALEHELHVRADALAGFVARQSEFAMLVGDRAQLESIASSALGVQDVVYVSFYDQAGKRVLSLNCPRVSPGGVPDTQSGQIIRDQLGIIEVTAPLLSRDFDLLEWAAPSLGTPKLGSVRIGLSTRKTRDLFRWTSWGVVAVAALALGVILFVQSRRLKRLLSPLESLTRFARQMDSGDYSQRATIKQRGEVGDLTAAFNQMLDRIEASHRQLTSALHDAQEASRLKGMFLANMSHEIRTPMNGIIGMTELAINEPSRAAQTEYLITVRDCASSLMAILNDILDFSKVEAGRMQLDPVDFNVREAVSLTLKPLELRAAEKGLRLTSTIAPDVPEWLHGDVLRLRQILTNLVSNGLKFTERGSVSINLENLGRNAGSELIQLTVTDTGIGIAPEYRDRIFEAFTQADGSTTRRYGGTGLGLSICARLAAVMGGSITVESPETGGSTFRVRIPLPAASAPAPVLVEPPRSATLAGPTRILLVEDNAVNQRLAARLLEKRGYATRVAANGIEALRAMDHEAFDLILMDVQMPEMDGFEATARIRQRESTGGCSRIPIVAMTAHAMKGDRERCLAAGMDGYVTKPIKPADLYSAIEETFRSCSQTAQSRT